MYGDILAILSHFLFFLFYICLFLSEWVWWLILCVNLGARYLVKHYLGVSVRVFLDVVNIYISRLNWRMPSIYLGVGLTHSVYVLHRTKGWPFSLSEKQSFCLMVFELDIDSSTWQLPAFRLELGHQLCRSQTYQPL